MSVSLGIYLLERYHVPDHFNLFLWLKLLCRILDNVKLRLILYIHHRVEVIVATEALCLEPFVLSQGDRTSTALAFTSM